MATNNLEDPNLSWTAYLVRPLAAAECPRRTFFSLSRTDLAANTQLYPTLQPLKDLKFMLHYKAVLLLISTKGKTHVTSAQGR